MAEAPAPQEPPAAGQVVTQEEGQTRRTIDRSTLSLPERYGAWLLAGGAIVAWALAVAETNEAVATVFAVAGLVLLAASAFYSRVVRISREGIDLADVVDVIESTAIEEGDTAQEVKARALEAVGRLALPDSPSQQSIEPARPSIRRAMLERERREAKLISYTAAWYQARGYRVEREPFVSERVRADLLATSDQEVLHIEVRSAVAILRATDAGAMTGGPPELPPGHRRVIVVAADTMVMADAKAVFAQSETSVLRVDVDTGEVEPLGADED